MEFNKIRELLNGNTGSVLTTSTGVTSGETVIPPVPTVTETKPSAQVKQFEPFETPPEIHAEKYGKIGSPQRKRQMSHLSMLAAAGNEKAALLLAELAEEEQIEAEKSGKSKPGIFVNTPLDTSTLNERNHKKNPYNVPD